MGSVIFNTGPRFPLADFPKTIRGGPFVIITGSVRSGLGSCVVLGRFFIGATVVVGGIGILRTRTNASFKPGKHD